MEKAVGASAVILAGGLSRRMGRDKVQLPFGAETMLSRVIRLYSGAFLSVSVSINRAGRFGLLPVRELEDRRPDEGPLAGLETALLELTDPVIFLTAADLPLADPSIAAWLCRLGGKWDACLLSKKEPLFGAYRRSCLPVVTELLDTKHRAMKDLLNRITCREIDPCARLLNVNQPADYQRAILQLETVRPEIVRGTPKS